MKRAAIGGLLVFALAACSPAHQIAISSDEPMRTVQVELMNVRKAEVRMESPNRAWADVWAGDSSGHIRITMASGREVACLVGYMTSGDVEPHIFLIERGECVEGIHE